MLHDADSAAAGSNENPFATSTASPASLGAATQGQSTAPPSPAGLGAAIQGQSTATTPPGAASADQDPFAEGASAASTSPSPATATSSSATTSGKTVSRGEASNVSCLMSLLHIRNVSTCRLAFPIERRKDVAGRILVHRLH